MSRFYNEPIGQLCKRDLGRIFGHAVEFGENIWSKPGGDKIPYGVLVGTLGQQMPAVEYSAVDNLFTERLRVAKTGNVPCLLLYPTIAPIISTIGSGRIRLNSFFTFTRRGDLAEVAPNLILIVSTGELF